MGMNGIIHGNLQNKLFTLFTEEYVSLASYVYQRIEALKRAGL